MENFEAIFLQKNSIVNKEDFDALYHEYKKTLKKEAKLNGRLYKIMSMSDKQLKHHKHNIEMSDRVNNRLNIIVKHSDKISTQALHERTALEDLLEQELEIEKELLKEIEDTQKEVVYTMGAIGETRSQETGLHVKRVAEYSRILAIYSGLSSDEVDILTQASPMHDIGKVAIEDRILNKPGKLTPQEFEIMKTHASIGYEMLKHSKRAILKAASVVAYEHHEKYDGTGYPNSLKGDEIHIYGRITALADVFDALGSSRIYKKAWSDEKIFKMFRDESGKHFDPKLIKIFFDHLEDFLSIRDLFRDKPVLSL